MGKVQSHVAQSFNHMLTEERKTQIQRSFVCCKDKAQLFKEITLLTKSSFQDAIESLNSMLIKSGPNNGGLVLFHSTPCDKINWKTAVRIFCIQTDQNNSDPVVTRVMNISQFWTLRGELMREFRRHCYPDDESSFQFVDTDGELISSEGVDECSAQMIERLNAIDIEEECSICMETKADVSLTCAHSFCRNCIEKWASHQTGDLRTCPQCRQVIKAEDEYWVMTDIPDKKELREYMALSMASLATGL